MGGKPEMPSFKVYMLEERGEILSSQSRTVACRGAVHRSLLPLCVTWMLWSLWHTSDWLLAWYWLGTREAAEQWESHPAETDLASAHPGGLKYLSDSECTADHRQPGESEITFLVAKDVHQPIYRLLKKGFSSKVHTLKDAIRVWAFQSVKFTLNKLGLI